MKKRFAVLTVVVVLLVGACGLQPLPDEPTSIPTLIPATLPPAQPTEPVQAGITPTTGGGDGSEAIAAGRQIFETNCTVCHTLTAETLVGPGLQGLFQRQALPTGQPVTDENLADWIHTGGGGMPAFPFDETQTAALIAFLKDATQ